MLKEMLDNLTPRQRMALIVVLDVAREAHVDEWTRAQERFGTFGRSAAEELLNAYLDSLTDNQI